MNTFKVGPLHEIDLDRAITHYLDVVLTKESIAFHITNEENIELKQRYELTGIPDRCILWNGTANFLKYKNGLLSNKQEETITRIVNAGFNVEVVRSIDDVEKALLKWGIPHTTSSVYTNE